MIGADALGKWLAAASLVEHPTHADPVDMCPFNTESDDPTRKDVHDDHHPETLQQDRLAAKQVDAPQAVACFSNDRQPRRTVASGPWARMIYENPAHHVLVELQTEGV